MSEFVDQDVQHDQTRHLTALHPRPSSSNTGVNLKNSTRTSSSPGLSLAFKSNSVDWGGSVSGRDRRPKDQDLIREDYEESSSSQSGTTLHGSRGTGASAITDFFSPEIFQLVIHNPTTVYRFFKFCQSRNCGENLEFLQKVDQYNRLLDELTRTLSTIHSSYTSPDASHQVNISSQLSKRVSADIKQSTKITIPILEKVFTGAQDHIERLLASDAYPRFVKHQVTAAATVALAENRAKFAGLGDCFCLTNPAQVFFSDLDYTEADEMIRIADNPIVFASDGFVSVTGYTRQDIIPRNCRFLQGFATDPATTSRLRQSIDNCEESVELLLNYRKDGEPFWNLLYCSPLFSQNGEVAFFLGGQINCSTTIHSRTDVLKVLSVNDDEIERMDEIVKERTRPPSIASRNRDTGSIKTKSSFFKSFRKYRRDGGVINLSVREEAGMEPGLIDRLGKLSFTTQVEAFYTAYSKYLVLSYNHVLQSLTIKHYSPGIIDMLCLNLPNGSIAPIFSKDIFKILGEHSPASAATAKAFREKVRSEISKGRALSVETGLLTGYEEKKTSGFRLGGGGDKKLVRVEEKYVCHWTPLKDKDGAVKWVVLTIAPKT